MIARDRALQDEADLRTDVPGGVQSRFLQVLGSDRGLATRRVVLGAALIVLLGALAWFLLPPLGLAVHAIGAAVGIGVGLLAAAIRARTWEASIRDQWAEWMRYALSCDSVPEIHRRIRGGSTRNAMALGAGLLLVAWAAETALLAMAVRTDPEAVWALPALVANGLAVGIITGHAIQRHRWTRQLQVSVSELVETGEIGVWGVL